MFINHILLLLKRHKLASLLSGSLSLILIILGIIENTSAKVITFLIVMFSCFIISELLFFISKINNQEYKINNPKKELGFVLFVISIGLLLLIFRFTFIEDFQSIEKWKKITLMVLRLLFLYPVLYFIYFLGIKRYSLKSIGINFNCWYIAIPIIALIGIASFFMFPEGLQFKDLAGQNIFMNFLMLGLLTAALPEELTRHLFQTRLSKVLNNKDLGWFIASLIWAFIHIPLFSNQSSLYEGVISSIGILPIGLLWGYLNQRYQSIFPSVLIHSTNLWGLQNIY